MPVLQGGYMAGLMYSGAINSQPVQQRRNMPPSPNWGLSQHRLKGATGKNFLTVLY